MPQTVKCPGCKLRLRYTRDLDGEPGVCPECEHLILPPEGTSQDAPDETLRAVKLIDDRLDDLQREGRALAREHDVRLSDAFDFRFDNKAEVEARLSDLKHELPVKESAYQPSGKMPASALGAMLLGTFAAIGLALVAEFVVGLLAAAVIGALIALNLAIACVGFIVFIAVIFAVIIGLIALVAPFAAGGWTAARVTTYFGQWGKNRNEAAASLLSMAATAISVLIVWGVYYFIGARMIDGVNLEFMSDSTLQWLGHGVVGVGGAIGVFLSLGAASTFVKDAKFCEECEEYMEETELRSLNAGAIHAMVLALQEEKPAVAAGMLCSDKGDDGKAMLYHCPCCDAGYVELTLQFKAKWQESGSEQNRDETWRVASVPLDEYAVEWFRIFKDEAGDDLKEED
jgi:hypothetical protein